MVSIVTPSDLSSAAVNNYLLETYEKFNVNCLSRQTNAWLLEKITLLIFHLPFNVNYFYSNVTLP